MRVLHTIHSIENRSAGPSYSVPHLLSALIRQNVKATLQSFGADQENEDFGFQHLVIPHPKNPIKQFNTLGVSTRFAESLRAQKFDIVHTHGLWRMPNVYSASVADERGKPFVLSPRGMLAADTLMFSRRRKKAFAILQQAKALRNVACFHATSQSEHDDIRELGYTAPIAIIPNGVQIPDGVLNEKQKKSFVYVGRLHPKKGLDRLIKAWSKIENRLPEWSVEMYGPDEIGYKAALNKEILDYGCQNITIHDPVFGDTKAKIIASARAFIMPTLHENFGMTVPESLSFGTPVICSKGAPWSDLVENGCGWWIDCEPSNLAETILQCANLDDSTISEMEINGRKLVKSKYAWANVGERMRQMYLWLDGAGPTPEFVHFL